MSATLSSSRLASRDLSKCAKTHVKINRQEHVQHYRNENQEIYNGSERLLQWL
jgi:hypothetical protein